MMVFLLSLNKADGCWGSTTFGREGGLGLLPAAENRLMPPWFQWEGSKGLQRAFAQGPHAAHNGWSLFGSGPGINSRRSPLILCNIDNAVFLQSIDVMFQLLHLHLQFLFVELPWNRVNHDRQALVFLVDLLPVSLEALLQFQTKPMLVQTPEEGSWAARRKPLGKAGKH